MADAIITAARPAAINVSPQDLRAARAAEEFEAMVLAQLLAPLFNSVETPGLAGGGPGEKAFQGLLQEHYAKAIAARGGVGVADQVKSALIALQAGAAPVEGE